MEIYVNDLSLHGQFDDLTTFKRSLNVLMSIRGMARHKGLEIYCHRQVIHARVTREMSMVQAIQHFDIDVRRAVMQWVTRHGPFWEDNRQHSDDEYFSHQNDIVTDSSLAEAAFCNLSGLESRLVSLSPSSWEFSPIPVNWHKSEQAYTEVEVANHWELDDWERVLQDVSVNIDSWPQLQRHVKQRFTHLTFVKDAFEHLESHPFYFSASKRILFLLDVLNRLQSCFDTDGNRTSEGHEIYNHFFKGDNALFSDSSSTERKQFEKEMTFTHPDKEGEVVFCPMHGKINNPKFRIHFSWPSRHNEPLYVVYVGPKITKR